MTYKLRYECPVDITSGDGVYHKTVKSYKTVKIKAFRHRYHNGMVEFQDLKGKLIRSLPQNRVIFIKRLNN